MLQTRTTDQTKPAASGRRLPAVLDVWHNVAASYGGVGPAASTLSSAISNRGIIATSQVAVCDRWDGDPATSIAQDVTRIVQPRLRGIADVRVFNALKPSIERVDICHVHAIWTPHSIAARRLAIDMGKPVVSSVHGALEPWDLNNKRLKKAIYASLLERPSLRRSSCLRALTEKEAGDYKNFGLAGDIAVVPNGVSIGQETNPEIFISRFPATRSKRIVLFMGRFHYKKGILNLLRSWNSVTKSHSDAHLVVCGQPQEDTGERAAQIIAEEHLEHTVTVAGVVNGELKSSAYSASKYFCLPSYSEGLSVAILEALSFGVPAVITPECNLPIIAGKGAGYLTSNKPEHLAETIIGALSNSSEQWEEMSLAAVRLARSEFNWNRIAADMEALYLWLLGGSKPSFVI